MEELGVEMIIGVALGAKVAQNGDEQMVDVVQLVVDGRLKTGLVIVYLRILRMTLYGLDIGTPEVDDDRIEPERWDEPGLALMPIKEECVLLDLTNQNII
jgi:hypothetical protein